MTTLPQEDPAGAPTWIGQRIGNYQLLRVLGQGGMGLVFEAVHEGMGSRAAIKILLPEVATRADVTARFFNEARAANAIQHPGIVRIFDCGYSAQGAAFLCMELLVGDSLRERLARQGRLSVPATLQIARQLASALVAAHQLGVVHRDLKPDNIMLARDPDFPGGERVKVLDFGIAKMAESLGGTALQTRVGMMLGTPTHMSPEQCRAAGSVTDRSDVYSFGIIVYQMLAGRPPFIGDSAGELLAQHLITTPPSLASFVPELPPELVAVVDGLLHKKPDQRPSMAEVLQRLELLQPLQPAAGLPRPLSVPPTGPPAGPAGLAVPADARGRSQPALPVLPPPAVTHHSLPSPPGGTAGPRTVSSTTFMTSLTGAASETQPLPRQAARRRRRPGMLAAGAILGGVVAAGWLMLAGRGPSPPPGQLPVGGWVKPARMLRPQIDSAFRPPAAATLPAEPLADTASTPTPLSREDLRLLTASKAFRHARYEETIKAAQGCAKVYPLESLWLIGMSACRQNQHELAKETLAKLAALRRDDAAASSEEIKRECSRTDVQRKLAELSDPSRPSGSTKDVDELYLAGNFRLARSLAEVYLDTDPETAWSYIGKSSCGMKDLDRATAAFKHFAGDAAKLTALKSACEKFKISCRDGQCQAK